MSYFSAKSAIICNSSLVNTFPDGLEGLQRMMAFGFCLNAFSNSSMSKSKFGGFNFTNIGSAPDKIASAL